MQLLGGPWANWFSPWQKPWPLLSRSPSLCSVWPQVVPLNPGSHNHPWTWWQAYLLSLVLIPGPWFCMPLQVNKLPAHPPQLPRGEIRQVGKLSVVAIHRVWPCWGFSQHAVSQVPSDPSHLELEQGGWLWREKVYLPFMYPLFCILYYTHKLHFTCTSWWQWL